MLLIVILFLPIAVWDSQTGRYHGYFNWKAAVVLLFTAVFYGYWAYHAGSDWIQIVTEIYSRLGQAVVGSRITVEFYHHSMHKVWLHRQYHKLTDHAGPREASL